MTVKDFPNREYYDKLIPPWASEAYDELINYEQELLRIKKHPMPLANAIRDFRITCFHLHCKASRPEIEVDDESGYVTLRWMLVSTGYSIVIRGDKKILVVETNFVEKPVVTSNSINLDQSHYKVDSAFFKLKIISILGN